MALALVPCLSSQSSVMHIFNQQKQVFKPCTRGIKPPVAVSFAAFRQPLVLACTDARVDGNRGVGVRAAIAQTMPILTGDGSYSRVPWRDSLFLPMLALPLGLLAALVVVYYSRGQAGCPAHYTASSDNEISVYLCCEPEYKLGLWVLGCTAVFGLCASFQVAAVVRAAAAATLPVAGATTKQSQRSRNPLPVSIVWRQACASHNRRGCVSRPALQKAATSATAAATAAVTAARPPPAGSTGGRPRPCPGTRRVGPLAAARSTQRATRMRASCASPSSQAPVWASAASGRSAFAVTPAPTRPPRRCEHVYIPQHEFIGSSMGSAPMHL